MGPQKYSTSAKSAKIKINFLHYVRNSIKCLLIHSKSIADVTYNDTKK